MFWIHGFANCKQISSLQRLLKLQSQEQKTLLPSTQAEKCPFLVCSLPRGANVSVQLQGNCPSTSLEIPQKKRRKRKKEQEPYMQRLQTIICVLYSACVSKHVFICSNAIHNVISNYSLSRQTCIHCASPMRMELVEVLWLSFCSGEPQTCLKECPSRA